MTPNYIKKIRLSPRGYHNDFDPEYISGFGKKMTQQRFAKIMGWGLKTVARWETGKEKPSLANELLLDAWAHSNQFRYFAELRYMGRMSEKD